MTYMKEDGLSPTLITGGSSSTRIVNVCKSCGKSKSLWESQHAFQNALRQQQEAAERKTRTDEKLRRSVPHQVALLLAYCIVSIFGFFLVWQFQPSPNYIENKKSALEANRPYFDNYHQSAKRLQWEAEEAESEHLKAWIFWWSLAAIPIIFFWVATIQSVAVVKAVNLSKQDKRHDRSPTLRPGYIYCPHCNAEMSVTPSAQRREADCPNCLASFVVPASRP